MRHREKSHIKSSIRVSFCSNNNWAIVSVWNFFGFYRLSEIQPRPTLITTNPQFQRCRVEKRCRKLTLGVRFVIQTKRRSSTLCSVLCCVIASFLLRLFWGVCSLSILLGLRHPCSFFFIFFTLLSLAAFSSSLLIIVSKKLLLVIGTDFRVLKPGFHFLFGEIGFGSTSTSLRALVVEESFEM